MLPTSPIRQQYHRLHEAFQAWASDPTHTREIKEEDLTAQGTHRARFGAIAELVETLLLSREIVPEEKTLLATRFHEFAKWRTKQLDKSWGRWILSLFLCTVYGVNSRLNRIERDYPRLDPNSLHPLRAVSAQAVFPESDEPNDWNGQADLSSLKGWLSFLRALDVCADKESFLREAFSADFRVESDSKFELIKTLGDGWQSLTPPDRNAFAAQVYPLLSSPYDSHFHAALLKICAYLSLPGKIQWLETLGQIEQKHRHLCVFCVVHLDPLVMISQWNPENTCVLTTHTFYMDKDFLLLIPRVSHMLHGSNRIHSHDSCNSCEPIMTILSELPTMEERETFLKALEEYPRGCNHKTMDLFRKYARNFPEFINRLAEFFAYAQGENANCLSSCLNLLLSGPYPVWGDNKPYLTAIMEVLSSTESYKRGSRAMYAMHILGHMNASRSQEDGPIQMFPVWAFQMLAASPFASFERSDFQRKNVILCAKAIFKAFKNKEDAQEPLLRSLASIPTWEEGAIDDLLVTLTRIMNLLNVIETFCATNRGGEWRSQYLLDFFYETIQKGFTLDKQNLLHYFHTYDNFARASFLSLIYNPFTET